MYERSYGYRYDETKNMTCGEIAKRIRQDVATAVSEGLLPSRWTYSVRSDTNSIDLKVRDCPDARRPCDGGRECRDVWCSARNDPHYAPEHRHAHEILTEEADAAKTMLQRIHGAYNHDGSEIQTDYFDVRYYGHVDFEDASSAAFRAKETERLAARKQARETGTIAGKVANYKRDGSHVVHLLMQQQDGKQVLGCGARIWRGSLMSKVADDTAVTCSRCAKRTAPVTAGGTA